MTQAARQVIGTTARLPLGRRVLVANTAQPSDRGQSLCLVVEIDAAR